MEERHHVRLQSRRWPAKEIPMDQKAEKALRFLREIKSVAFATVNNGEPAVRIAVLWRA